MRRWVGLLALALIGLLSGDLLARGLDRFYLRVDLARGQVTSLASPSLPAHAVTTPRAPRPLVTTYDKTAVIVRDAQGQTKLTLTVGKLDREWMPWSILQPGVLIFDWRERVFVPGKLETTRDVVRGVDLAGGQELWRRDTLGACAGAIGDHLLLLCTGHGSFDLVDSRTGGTLRALPLTGGCPAVLAIAGGDTLVDTGDNLARLDGRGALVWQSSTLGAVASITPLAQPTARYRWRDGDDAPLPATGEWLLLTHTQIMRMDPTSSRVAWAKPSTTTDFVIDGGQIVESDISRSSSATSAQVKLVVRDLATGKVTQDLVVQQYTKFFDDASAAVLDKQGGVVELSTEFLVLD
jgi:hypothetical protein